MLLLILGGAILRIYTSMDFFLHEWDERFHALVAKNLILHPLKPTLYENPILPYDYQNWLSNHIWVHKQPLPLWGMALSMYFFGINEVALRIPSILLTTLGIWLTFYIGSFFFNKKAGFISAFLYSINGLIIELTSGRVATDHVDIFFLFFIELAVFFVIRYVETSKNTYTIFTGLAMGAAILSKWLPALIVLPIWLLIILESKKLAPKQIILQFLVLAFSCSFFFLPWQIYIRHIYPLETSWESSHNIRHLTEVLSEQGGSWYYFINKIRINYGELVYLPIVWFTWQTIKKRDFKHSALLIWLAIPLIFFSCIKTKMQAYILFSSPAIFIITAEFCHFLLLNRKNWLYQIILILLIILPLRYTIERIKPFNDLDRNPQWVSELKELNKLEINKGVLFNYSKPIEAMFYTNFIVYSTIPSTQIIDSIHKNGFSIFINTNKHLPKDFLRLKQVTFINIKDK